MSLWKPFILSSHVVTRFLAAGATPNNHSSYVQYLHTDHWTIREECSLSCFLKLV